MLLTRKACVKQEMYFLKVHPAGQISSKVCPLLASLRDACKIPCLFRLASLDTGVQFHRLS